MRGESEAKEGAEERKNKGKNKEKKKEGEKGEEVDVAGRIRRIVRVRADLHMVSSLQT